MKGRILVTGAAKRIGRAIALDLARDGWDIVVHYNTSVDDAVKTAEDIVALGREAWLAEIDLADLPRVEKLIPALARGLGPLAALVNNASLFMQDGSVADDLHMNVNAEGPRVLSETFAKQVPANGTGVIINILDADPTAPKFSQYNASKKRLEEMTHEMAVRFAPLVRVNGVALGQALKNPRQSEENFQLRAQQSTIGRVQDVVDVTSSVRRLIDDTSITGSVISGHAPDKES